MPIQRIHPRKLFRTPFTSERTIIRMKRFMPLAIVLSGKRLGTPRPMTNKRLFFIMGSHMPYRHELISQPTFQKEPRSPFKLKLLVNVLPHPGTVHTNGASAFRLLTLAFLVRSVVTLFFLTFLAARP